MSRISFVVAAHGECNELDNLIGSLRTQLEYVESSGPRGERFRYKTVGQLNTDDIEIVVSWDGPSNGKNYPNVRQITNPKAEVPCTGHNTREPGILASTGDWVVLTNADNYYCQGWLSAFKRTLRERPLAQVVYWDCVNNLWRWNTRRSVLSVGAIDLGCVAVRRDIALSVGFPWRHYEGDWEYINACVGKVGSLPLRDKIVHIPEILFVHN